MTRQGHALDYGDGVIYADIDYLQRILRTPESTLRRWARDDGWPRRKIRGRAYYLLAAATVSHNRRRDTPMPKGA